MSIQIAEISQRLQSALDQSYNVADMDTVLQVISTLENIQITKEQLETTRLGKYINHLRRKTANESLARRAKNLLKKWREMVLPSAGATQQQANANTQQHLMPTIAKDSPAALGIQYDGRGVQPPYYNQMKEPAQFHDVTSTSLDNSKYPSSDSRRYGRGHDTGSNHASASLSKNFELAAEPSEDCTQRYSKFHDINKSNLSTNIGRTSATSNFSGKSKETDPYRTLSNINDNSKSHISISALPKIPKIKNSAATQRLSKHTDRSHSPLVNLKESSSPKFASIAHDDNSMHAYDIQNYKRFPPNQSGILNGRNQDYGENNSTAMDNNSNSSSINIISEIRNVPNVSQPSSEHVNNEVVKKKHKKHKKDKKSKKQKQSSSPPADRIPVAGPSILELPDSLSSNSMSLFASTSDSIKDQHVLTNNNAFVNSIGTSLPSTSINAITPASAAQSSTKNARWTPTQKFHAPFADDLTFTGKFTSKNDDNIIINIDSSSGSNSPKYRTPSRSSSPSRLNMIPVRVNEYGSRVATDEENSSNQHISLIQQTESSRASPFGDLVQDELLANDAIKATHAQSIVASNVMDVQQTGKKRGRKKGSKGVDSRLGSASNSSQSQQAGAPYYDSISFSSLKNKIDSIRGTTKKVKTTKELLAELQNRKATPSGDDVTVIDAQLQSTLSHPDDDESAVINGKHNSGSRTVTPTPPPLTSAPRSERSSKKSKSMSDNQTLHENQVVAEITQPKSVIDQEISELCAKLPAISKSALRVWRKAQIHDAIPCTCKLIEVEGLIDGVQTSENTDTDIKDPNLVNESVPKMLTDCNVLPQTTAPFDRSHQQASDSDQCAFTKPIPKSNFNSTVATSTSIPIINPTTNEQRPPESMDPPAKKPTVKSIFDLDYDDDDDDPITFKLNHNNNINLNTKVKLSSSRDSNNDISDDKSCDELFLNENIKRDDDDIERDRDGVAGTVKQSVPINDSVAAKSNFLNIDQTGHTGDDVDRKDIVIDVNVIAGDSAAKSVQDEPKPLNATVDLNAMALQSRFRIEEDPDCKAKELYITSKQSITEFHIEQLHTSYIPNINGNWDDAKNEEESVAMDTTAGSLKTTESSTGENPSQMQCDDDEPSARGKDDMESITIKQQNDELDDTEATLAEIENEPRITEASIGLYDRVVPLCNHLNMDRLPKSLSHINLDFGPNDEVEPHIFIASIQVKKEVITTDQVSSPTNECEIDDAAKHIDQSNSNANSEDLVADDTFATRIHQNFPIYDCDNDINDVECGRKRSPELNFADMNRECETMEPDFDCEPVDQQLDMEVDDIVINNDDIKSENDLCPIANDPFIEAAENKHFNEESDVESFAGDVVRPSSIIDENARADADDIEPLHQVIDLNPTQILPATDENAMDSMDFENQLSKSYDMTMVNEQEECKTGRIRSDDSKSNEATDAELEPVGSIPTTDLSDSDDDVNEVNDDSSLEEDLSFDNYEQEDTSNDHFITLDNFDAALVPSSSEFKQSPSNNSGSSCDEEPNKDTALEGKLFGSMVCDDENEMSDDSDDIDDDSDTINNLVVPTMFCKPVFIEGGKSSNLLNDNSDSQSASSEPKPLDAESSDSSPGDKPAKDPELKEPTSMSESHEPTVQKLTKDALETHQALSSLNELSNQQKRFRSSSSSSISSTSSSSSSSSTLSPRSKKMKRWMRRRPCPQHYRCASTSSQSSSHSPMSALSPSSMFTNSNAIEPTDPARMDITESTNVRDFVPVPDLEEHVDSGFDNDHIQKTISEGGQEEQQFSQETLHKDRNERIDTVIETNTSSLPTFDHDEIIEGSASLAGNRDDDLLFQQLPLPDQLLQSDEKDGDDDSNSANGIHRNGLSENNDSIKPADGDAIQDQNKEKNEHESSLSSENNGMLPSFNSLDAQNMTGVSVNGYKFKEWYEVVHVKSYNDELLTILPYVVID